MAAYQNDGEQELHLVEPFHPSEDLQRNLLKAEYQEDMGITYLETTDLRGPIEMPIVPRVSTRAKANRAGATANIWTTLGANCLNIIWTIGSFAGAWGK